MTDKLDHAKVTYTIYSTFVEKILREEREELLIIFLIIL